ncbi:MAG TPA: BON domain-containing protein [Methylomirabilota bacterium]|jgi:hyperosmotically inducible protein|nr:BON domain-containing protein [Methylomirabilota bacterium]
MLHRLRVVIGLVLAATFAFGCASMTGKTVGQTVDDSVITASVKTKLAQEKLGTLTKIDVDTNRGTVYLNGTVDNAAMKARASELARQVAGVRDVVNNLQVRAQ